LNVILEEGLRELEEKLPAVVEFPLKKKISKPNCISNKNISPILSNNGDISTKGIISRGSSSTF
jgi:hypothetical protein